MLSPGDQLCKTLGEKKGNLDQHEREHYDIIDAQGQVVGTVEYSASTLLRPPHRTSYWLVQKDIEGNVIVDKRW